ncbi:MAG: cytochrome c oxidase accessory protein CcoG [Sphingomonadaceae bacterium]
MSNPDSPSRSAEQQELYEKHEPVFNKRVDGPFRRFKWAMLVITLAIYYITPWIRWDRGAYAPDQAVLIDLANRRFYMFSIEIWPHEFYYVAGLLIMAGIGLFLVTSVAGRAWCGYSCPQTVWTDLFQHIDRLVDGDRNARMRLHKAPWTASKIARRLFKWTIYLTIAFWTGGAWIMYFADAPTLTQQFWAGQAATTAYITVAILTLTTFIFGGFMREQVCIYMCPWPRIQSAMLDEKSLLVTYKFWRGEKRGSLKKAAKEPEIYGDCIDCNQCVAVCPTGYDIRNGPDIACITCGLCIDACDKVMREVGRPRGLIDYATLEDCEAEKAGGAAKPAWRVFLHPRTLIYTAIWGSIGLAMLFVLGNRTHLSISADPDRNPPYMLMSDGSIRNSYTLKIRNMESRPRDVTIAMSGMDKALMWTGDMNADDARRNLTVDIPADVILPVRVYVIAPPGSASEKFTLTAQTRDSEAESDSVSVSFTGPGDE